MSNFKILKSHYEEKNAKKVLVAKIDGLNAASLSDFYKQISKQLKLPSHFGNNLDGLYDCLCDFSWLDENEIHIVFQNYDSFLSAEPKNKRWDVLVTLNDAADEWRKMRGKDKIKLEMHVEPAERIKADLSDAEI